MPHEATPAPKGSGHRDQGPPLSLSKLAPSIVAHTMIIADRTPPRKGSHPRHVIAHHYLAVAPHPTCTPRRLCTAHHVVRDRL